jgi:hypothetical protein
MDTCLFSLYDSLSVDFPKLHVLEAPRVPFVSIHGFEGSNLGKYQSQFQKAGL